MGKRFIATVIAAVFSLSMDAAPSNVDNRSPNEVWISADHIDGEGKGTQLDPFDGSSSPKLDAILRGIANNTTVHFGRGTFETVGHNFGSTTQGFSVKRGCTYIGAGRNVTIIKQISTLYAYTPYVFYSGDPPNVDTSGAEVRDLTVDCNGAALVAANSPDLASRAILLRGSHCSIVNVRAIHVYGHFATGREAFAIGISAAYSGGSPIGSTNALIENCLVDNFATGCDYGQMICLSDVSGRIKGCQVIGQTTLTSAYQAYGSNIILENDVAINCLQFLYMDAGNVDHLTVRNCRGYGITSKFVSFFPSAGFVHHDLVVRNSTCDFTGAGTFLHCSETDANSVYNVRAIGNKASQSVGSSYVPFDLYKTKNFYAANNRWLGNPQISLSLGSSPRKRHAQ